MLSGCCQCSCKEWQREWSNSALHPGWHGNPNGVRGRVTLRMLRLAKASVTVPPQRGCTPPWPSQPGQRQALAIPSAQRLCAGFAANEAPDTQHVGLPHQGREGGIPLQDRGDTNRGAGCGLRSRCVQVHDRAAICAGTPGDTAGSLGCRNADFLRHIFPRIEWAAFLEGARAVRHRVAWRMLHGTRCWGMLTVADACRQPCGFAPARP